MAVLAAWLPGVLLWIVMLGRPRGGSAWSAALGAGFVLGMLGLGILLRFAASLPVSGWFPALAPWSLVASAAAAAVLWRWQSSVPVVTAPASPLGSTHERGVSMLLLALLIAHAVLLTAQAVNLPTLAWDAWNAWLGKSRAWVGADLALPLADVEGWLAAPSGTALYALAPHYPDTVPRMAAWFASAAGGWNESAVHLAWPLLWIALGAMLFGYLRLAGARTSVALLGAFGVLSLPLVNAHAALAGYADLWLAALLLLAVLHTMRAIERRSWRDGLMALLCALLLPAVKLEGAVWLLCLLAAAALAAVPARYRPHLFALSMGVLLLGLLLGGLQLPLPGLGTVRLQWGAIDIPAIGPQPLFWRPVLVPVLESLFVLPNWHLLWYVAPFALLLGWGRIGSRDGQRLGLYFLFGGYSFLFVLFFLTDASAWAENLTSLNRVLLQVVPVTVFWLVSLWQDRPAVRGRWS